MALSAFAADPRFEDYPAVERHNGTTASPVISFPEARYFRGQIRQGVAGMAKPNFAGKYRAIRWGCGSDCVMMAVVDAASGAVYSPPLAPAGSLHLQFHIAGVREADFRADSRLMILRDACADFTKPDTCGLYYFQWTGQRFTLLRFLPRVLDGSRQR